MMEIGVVRVGEKGSKWWIIGGKVLSKAPGVGYNDGDWNKPKDEVV